MMPDYRCSLVFTGVRACPEWGPVGCAFDILPSLAADLIVLPYDIAKPLIYEKCRWNSSNAETTGIPPQSLQLAVNDLAERDRLDSAGQEKLERKIAFLSWKFKVSDSSVETILRVLNEQSVPLELLDARFLELVDLHDRLTKSFGELLLSNNVPAAEAILVDARLAILRGEYDQAVKELEYVSEFYRGVLQEHSSEYEHLDRAVAADLHGRVRRIIASLESTVEEDIAPH